ncbi:hypothetical protein DM02DRAFT_663564 [Periconia macrospinosa]|uniref:Uncharacterized protein n=1 Tax=Periconia macrospinosa TaxID=97972 RepID=A0A2V1D3L8_9PLEO|nr:hypothetical protein DM02DRAFT_663564 [Periconia macrospinosa]
MMGREHALRDLARKSARLTRAKPLKAAQKRAMATFQRVRRANPRRSTLHKEMVRAIGALMASAPSTKKRLCMEMFRFCLSMPPRDRDDRLSRILLSAQQPRQRLTSDPCQPGGASATAAAGACVYDSDVSLKPPGKWKGLLHIVDLFAAILTMIASSTGAPNTLQIAQR